MKVKDFWKLQLFAEDTEGGKPYNVEDSHTGGGEPEKNEVKYTDADVDKIIDKKFAEWEKKHQKKVDEAAKLAEMNAQERAEYERNELQKKLDEYERKDAIAGMTNTARKMLADNHIVVSDELLAVLVTPDADKTKQAVDGFVTAFNDAVEEAVKERLKGKTPSRSSGKATMTKEEISAIKDPELRQQKMLENRELYDF